MKLKKSSIIVGSTVVAFGVSPCLAMDNRRPLVKTLIMDNPKKKDRVKYELMSPVFQVPSLIYYYLCPMKIEKELAKSADGLGVLPSHARRRLGKRKPLTQEQKERYDNQTPEQKEEIKKRDREWHAKAKANRSEDEEKEFKLDQKQYLKELRARKKQEKINDALMIADEKEESINEIELDALILDAFDIKDSTNIP